MPKDISPAPARIGDRVADPTDQLGIGTVVAERHGRPEALFVTLSGIAFNQVLPLGTPALPDRIVAAVRTPEGEDLEIDVTEAVLSGDFDRLRALRDGPVEAPASWAARETLAESGWEGCGRVALTASVAAFLGREPGRVERGDHLQAAAMFREAQAEMGPVPAP